MSIDELRLVRQEGDTIHCDFSGLPDVLFSLGQVPEILKQRDTGAARARLFPDVQPGHAEENLEWHEAMDDDLRHLFESAGETLANDLDRAGAGSIRFPARHLPAWMSAINQARLVLGELHKIEEPDMARRDLDIRDVRDTAIYHVHMLGALLESLVRL